MNYTAVADANYSVIASDNIVALTSITASRILSLPTSSTVHLGHAWLFMDISGVPGLLSQSLTWTVDGFPKLAPWVVRKTIGPLVLRRILRTGRFPDGIKLPKPYLPKPGLDDRAEAEALRAALWHFASHTGPLSDHPMAGQIARADWERFHCIHCAGHLGFVLPIQW